MKLFKVLILSFLFLPFAFLGTTGCKDDTTTPPTKNDTTDNPDPDPTYLVSFKLGFELYELAINNSLTTANYNTLSDLTKIVLTGNDATKGKTEVKLEFPGKTTGTFKQIDGDDVLLEITENKGDPVKEVTYQTDPETNLIISITEYGNVGDTIRGTFSGKLKVGINSREVKNGVFATVRKDDI